MGQNFARDKCSDPGPGTNPADASRGEVVLKNGDKKKGSWPLNISARCLIKNYGGKLLFESIVWDPPQT